ncbi:19812_t:CDS:2, partial [Funneliformis geosporum]
LHIPLVVCRLGSDNARFVVSSFYHVILKKPRIRPLNNLELWYVKELNDDLTKGMISDFGLSELLLQNNDFFKEFENFCMADKLSQVERRFTKLDLKTYSNMSLLIKQSKLHLSSNKIDKKIYQK